MREPLLKTTSPVAVNFPLENLTPLDQRCVAPIRRYAPLLAHTLRWAPRSVFLSQIVFNQLCEYSRNENLSTQDHRILVIKKQTSKNDFGPAEADRPQSDPAGGVFGSLFFYISIYDNTCSKFYSSVCSTTGST